MSRPEWIRSLSSRTRLVGRCSVGNSVGRIEQLLEVLRACVWQPEQNKWVLSNCLKGVRLRSCQIAVKAEHPPPWPVVSHKAGHGLLVASSPAVEPGLTFSRDHTQSLHIDWKHEADRDASSKCSKRGAETHSRQLAVVTSSGCRGS